MDIINVYIPEDLQPSWLTDFIFNLVNWIISQDFSEGVSFKGSVLSIIVVGTLIFWVIFSSYVFSLFVFLFSSSFSDACSFFFLIVFFFLFSFSFSCQFSFSSSCPILFVSSFVYSLSFTFSCIFSFFIWVLSSKSFSGFCSSFSS